MPLDVGSRLAHYDVTALIGAGGMGEVYRARDTKLKCDVVLKVKPDAFASRPDRLARFRPDEEIWFTERLLVYWVYKDPERGY